MSIQSYRDLRVWQAGMDIAATCYELTKKYPREELYGLTSQIRRSSTSFPANSAEGYGRSSTGEYAQFLRIVQGSLKELETHLLLSARIGLTTQEHIAPLLAQSESLGKMLLALQRSLHQSTPSNA